ncbi:Spo0E like sporulation regulatory protein [Clostridium acidisoli DSM 12555]|uniref:Spo0E like sporulation regulatory protein n=1 Tax=Clostridium acidisoli DSM 12555 TaxID=1121291 RepID=A0A1W1XWH0_9CLOT|nr:aspartyl-phosphate phosphatase Spo0E family protein [Clostridium acidisoli]SMC28276.1 Spo0E like sporulation regulatory protein [Clostridium acidisoli DSM 12555]
MSLKEEIEVLRDLLNNMIENEDKLSKSNIVDLSQRLDKLIELYYKGK